MKLQILLVLFFLPLFLQAQSTPQWLFPIWFEDANGDKDTVYIGYDPAAELLSGVYDEVFESYIKVDTTKFNVLVNSGAPSPFTGIYNSDSGKTEEVTSSMNPGFDIDFIKGQMPITMYWDMNLLYSDNLPYSYQFPYPNAIVYVYCAAGEPGYVNCPSAFDLDPLSMTDSVNIYYDYPISSPHLFDGSGISPSFNEPEEVLGSFSISIDHYQIQTSIQNIQDNFQIAPNPFSNYINIRTENNINKIYLYDLRGNIVKVEYDVYLKEFSLSTENLPNSIYYLHIQTNKNFISAIILKQ